MAREIVTAIYKPKKDQGAALEALLKEHVPTLRRQGLATDRPSLVMRSHIDGSIMEVFEWASHEAAAKAHSDPEVGKLWEAMGEVARFLTPAELMESTRTFPHFQPVDELCL
ncbi:MAG: hypothetical protein QNJ98_18400 [Planctomycetota bacterium]|nr:hypothetical protein [Planctomycetota bacterium]